MTHSNDKFPSIILPIDTMTALSFMIGLSQELCNISEQEHLKISQDDFVGLALLQEHKKALADTYSAASKEFKARIDEFKTMDKGLLKQLENLQKELGEKAQKNAFLLNDMLEKMQRNTHSTLLDVQSMAQATPATHNGNSFLEKESA